MDATDQLIQVASLLVGALAAAYAILAFGGTRWTNREAQERDALASRPRPQLVAHPYIPHPSVVISADVTNAGGVATSYVLFFGDHANGLYMSRGSLPAHCPPTAVPFTPLGKNVNDIYPPAVSLAKGIDGRWWDSWTDKQITDRTAWLEGWPKSLGVDGIIDALNVPPVDDFVNRGARSG